MSEQHEEELNLFEDEPQERRRSSLPDPVATAGGEDKGKKRGKGLLERMGLAGGNNNEGESSTGPGPGGADKRKQRPLSGEGTQLGFPGWVPKSTNSTILEKVGEDGKKVSVDVFREAFLGQDIGLRQFEGILNYLHRTGNLDFAEFIEGISYQGFNRVEYIKSSLKKVSISIFCRFAILGAVRGSNFEKIKNTCTDMPSDLTSLVNSGMIVKKAKKKDEMTILRFTASIPHWVAFWLFSTGVGKKIESEPCPAWLQFPGAASIPMSKEVRLQHISFCKAFSAILPGGTFNGNIYYTAFSNAIPETDVPSIIKDGLGIGAARGQFMTGEEVRGAVVMTVAIR